MLKDMFESSGRKTNPNRPTVYVGLDLAKDTAVRLARVYAPHLVESLKLGKGGSDLMRAVCYEVTKDLGE